MSELLDKVIPYLTWLKTEKRWCMFYEEPFEIQSLYEPDKEHYEALKRLIASGWYDNRPDSKKFTEEEIKFMEEHEFHHMFHTKDDMPTEETSGQHPEWCMYSEHESWVPLSEDIVSGLITSYVTKNGGEVIYGYRSITIRTKERELFVSKAEDDGKNFFYDELIIRAFIDLCDSIRSCIRHD